MSCLFNSLSHFIVDLDEHNLRNIICDYLQTNPVVFDNIDADKMINWRDDINLTQYISEMRNTNTWGSSLEIKSFCNIFNIIVIVHHLNRQIEFIPNNTPKFAIHIKYNGNHFEPIKSEIL